MRRFFLLTVTCMVTICAVGVGFASAGGNGSTTTPFAAGYDENGLHSSCTGTRVVQKDGTTKDSEICILSGDTSRVVAGTIKGNPGFCFNGVCHPAWGSDMPDVLQAKSVTLVLTANLDGTFTQNITAYY